MYVHTVAGDEMPCRELNHSWLNITHGPPPTNHRRTQRILITVSPAITVLRLSTYSLFTMYSCTHTVLYSAVQIINSQHSPYVIFATYADFETSNNT